ncbi:MAG: hypothetical protein WAT79_16025 [Saprospiraceae bacterium]
MNENRKLQKSKTEYYKQLLEELNLYVKETDPKLKRIEKSISSYNAYLANFETPNLPFDSIYQNIKKVTPIFNPTRFNTKTIEVLKTTGDIKLMPKAIRNLLVSLDNQQNLYYEVNDVNYGLYLNTAKDAYLINVFSIQKMLVNQEQLSNALNIKTSLADQIAKLHLAITLKNFAEKNEINSLKDNLNITHELKNMIEKEVSSLINDSFE